MYVQFDTNCKITLKPIQFAARNCIFYYNLVVFAFVIIILSEIFRHYNISFLFEVSNLGKNTSHQDITSNLMLELTRGGGLGACLRQGVDRFAIRRHILINIFSAWKPPMKET